MPLPGVSGTEPGDVAGLDPSSGSGSETIKAETGPDLPAGTEAGGDGAAFEPVGTRDVTVLRHGDVVIAAITSCTNTSNPSLMIAAGLVAKKAVERGLEAKPWVKTSLAPGSHVVAEVVRQRIPQPLAGVVAQVRQPQRLPWQPTDIGGAFGAGKDLG